MSRHTEKRLLRAGPCEVAWVEVLVPLFIRVEREWFNCSKVRKTEYALSG